MYEIDLLTFIFIIITESSYSLENNIYPNFFQMNNNLANVFISTLKQ